MFLPLACRVFCFVCPNNLLSNKKIVLNPNFDFCFLFFNLWTGLEGVERKLNEHISYLSQVSTNQQHEGSIYSEEKRFQLVCESTDTVLKRIKALEKRVYQKNKEQLKESWTYR